MKKSKINVLVLSLVLVLTMVIGVIPAEAAKVKINKTKANMEVGDVITLKISGTSSSVYWSSSNKAVAKVSANGKKCKVTALKAGSTKIKAKVNKKTYSCAITVVDPAPWIDTSNIELPMTLYDGSGKTMYSEMLVTKVTVEDNRSYKPRLKIQAKRVNGSSSFSYMRIGYTLYDLNGDIVEQDHVSTEVAIGSTGLATGYIDATLDQDETYYLELNNNGGYTPTTQEDETNKAITIILPSVPVVLYNYESNKLQSSFNVMNVSYSVDGDTVEYKFTVEKLTDTRGSGQSDQCKIGYKLYDSEGFIIDSGTWYSESMKVGDKVRDATYWTAKSSGLKQGETYRLEIMSVN